MQFTRFILIFFSLFYSLLSWGNSQESSEPDTIERKWDFGIGLGYGYSSNPFVGSDGIPTFISLDFSIYGEKFFFDNGEFGFTFIDKPNFGMNIISTFNSERIYYSYLNELGLNANNSNNTLSVSETNPLSSIDANTIITPIPNPDPDIVILPSPAPPSASFFPPGDFTVSFALPKKDFSFNLGLELIYDHEIGSFNFQVSQDVIGTHSGNDARFIYSKGFQYNRWIFAGEVGVHWKSDKIIDYYYGVDFSVDSEYNITELDVLYEGKSGTDSLVGLTANYRINNNLSLVGNYKFNTFSNSIFNSPLIDSKYKHNIFVGLFYRF